MAATDINAITLTISNDRTTGTINDNNTARITPLNDHAGYLTVYKTSFDATELAVLTTATSAVITGSAASIVATGTDTTWTFGLSGDGWYKSKYLAIPYWDVATAYLENDIVFDLVGTKAYQAIANITGGSRPELNPGGWTLIADPVTEIFSTIGTATDPSNIYYQEYDQVLSPNLQKAFGDQIALAALEASGDFTRSADVELYELLGLFSDAILIANTRFNYSYGEKIARKAAQLY